MTWEIGVLNGLRNGGRWFDHVAQFGLSGPPAGVVHGHERSWPSSWRTYAM